MTQADPCRFCRLYAISVVVFAALLGALLAVQLRLSSGISEYMPVVLISNTLRAGGPAVSGSGLLLALVLWAHPLSAGQIQDDLRRILRRALLVTLPGYLVAVAIAIASGCAVALVLGQSWGTFRLGFAEVGWRDFGRGALSTLVDAALIVFLARRFAARLQLAGLSLPGKLVVVLTVSVGLRATVGLILSSLLSA